MYQFRKEIQHPSAKFSALLAALSKAEQHEYRILWLLTLRCRILLGGGRQRTENLMLSVMTQAEMELGHIGLSSTSASGHIRCSVRRAIY